MKRIVVFLLVIAMTIPALFSCGKPSEDSNLQTGLPNVNLQQLTPVQAVAAMYKVSQPTKVVATTKHVLVEDVLELNGKYEIVTGYVDNSPASVYKEQIDTLRSVDEGGQNDEVKDLVKTTSKVIEAIEGKGSRTNGGDWKEDGTVWTIGRGRMSINLQDDLVKNVTYENHTLTLDVPQANVAKVLGEEYAQKIGSDVHVVIVDDGAVVTSIELTYSVAADEEANLDVSEMSVKVYYTYDIERITIE